MWWGGVPHYWYFSERRMFGAKHKENYFQERVIRRLSFLLNNIPGLLKALQAPLTAELLTLL